ncbi:MAG: hypothetical protein P9M06_07910 [Candidatus Saelkia tenebricola]|nr:hypothetical protein [Candidatus Saelkia tenebricola]
MNPFEKTVEPILGKVVFVKKGIYGSENMYLRGTVKNITDKPYKNVIVAWTFWNANNELFSG